jgi:hypothetical protein
LITTLAIPTKDRPESLKRALASFLPKDGVRSLVINGWSTAAARNMILRLTKGQQVAMVDDDMQGALALAHGLDLRGSATPSDPTSFWYETEPGWNNVDIMTLHQTQLDAGAITSHIGVNGDSGMGSMAYLLFLEGQSRDRIYSNEETYRTALYDRRVMRCSGQTKLVNYGPSLTGCIGIDNSKNIPPFPEGIERNSDGVWMEVLRAVNPDARQAYLPWAVRHDPPVKRGGDPVEGAGRFRASGALIRMIRAQGQKTMAELGECLEVLSHYWQLDHVVRYYRGQYLMGLADEARAALRSHDGPSYWLADMERYLAALKLEMEQPFSFSDLPGGIEQFRGIVSDYGKLLQSWTNRDH